MSEYPIFNAIVGNASDKEGTSILTLFLLTTTMMVVRVVLEIAMSARDCRWTLGREGGRGGGTVSAADSDRRAIDSDGGQAAVAVIRGEV